MKSYVHIFSYLVFGIVASMMFAACSANNVYVKIHQTAPSNWDSSSPAIFEFQPLKPTSDIFVVWRVDGDANVDFDVQITTKALSNGKYFVDTLSLNLQNSTQIRSSGNLKDLSMAYCKNADFNPADSLIQVIIQPIEPVKGLHYIGIEVSNATFVKN